MYRPVEKTDLSKPCIPYGIHPMVLAQVAYLRHARIGGEHLFLPSGIPYTGIKTKLIFRGPHLVIATIDTLQIKRLKRFLIASA